MGVTYSAGSNNITRLQRLTFGNSLDQGRDGKDEIFGSRPLPKLTVDMGLNLQNRWQVVLRNSNRAL